MAHGKKHWLKSEIVDIYKREGKGMMHGNYKDLNYENKS